MINLAVIETGIPRVPPAVLVRKVGCINGYAFVHDKYSISGDNPRDVR